MSCPWSVSLVLENTNTLITTAKMNASQELTAWSYQTVGDAIYKQSQQQINGEKRGQASAQTILLSGQFYYKLTEPDDRLLSTLNIKMIDAVVYIIKQRLLQGGRRDSGTINIANLNTVLIQVIAFLKPKLIIIMKTTKVLLLGWQWNINGSFLTTLPLSNLLALKSIKSLIKQNQKHLYQQS
jgi:hypothetical protein